MTKRWAKTWQFFHYVTECFGISSISNICMPSLKRSFNVVIKNTLILQRWYVKIPDIRPMQGSNRRQDPGFHTLDLDSWSVNLDSGFQSLARFIGIGGLFELNSECQSPGFHIPPAKTSRIQEFAHPDLWELSVMNVAISRLFLNQEC